MSAANITCTDCDHAAPLADFVDHHCPPLDGAVSEARKTQDELDRMPYVTCACGRRLHLDAAPTATPNSEIKRRLDRLAEAKNEGAIRWLLGEWITELVPTLPPAPRPTEKVAALSDAEWTDIDEAMHEDGFDGTPLHTPAAVERILAARSMETCPVDGCSTVRRGQSCPRQAGAES